jgi:hypothetical protein
MAVRKLDIDEIRIVCLQTLVYTRFTGALTPAVCRRPSVRQNFADPPFHSRFPLVLCCAADFNLQTSSAT